MHEAELVATTVYGINLLLAPFLLGALWRYALRESVIRADATDAEVMMLSKQPVPSLAGYVIVIVLWLFVTLLAALGYPVIAVYIILPVHAIRRRGSGS